MYESLDTNQVFKSFSSSVVTIETLFPSLASTAYFILYEASLYIFWELARALTIVCLVKSSWLLKSVPLVLETMISYLLTTTGSVMHGSSSFILACISLIVFSRSFLQSACAFVIDSILLCNSEIFASLNPASRCFWF